MTTGKWLIPDNLNPATDVCYIIKVPNDEKYIAAFWGNYEELAKAWNWEDSFGDGSTVAYKWRDYIDNALLLARAGSACDMPIDCNEVEACLSTSVIINDLSTDVINNTTNITNNYNYIQDTEQGDGNTYPPPPDPSVEPDKACNAAFYLSNRLRGFIAEIESVATTYPNEVSALEALLDGVYNLLFTNFYPIIATFFSLTPPTSVLPDYDAQIDDIRQTLYCDSMVKSSFSDWVRANLTNGDAIADFIDCIGLGTWSQWTSIGSEQLGADCSSYCPSGQFQLYIDFTQDPYTPPVTKVVGKYQSQQLWRVDAQSSFLRVWLRYFMYSNTEWTNVEIDYYRFNKPSAPNPLFQAAGFNTVALEYGVDHAIINESGSVIGELNPIMQATSQKLNNADAECYVYNVRLTGNGLIHPDFAQFKVYGDIGT